MAFFLLCVYLVIVLIRPQELMESMEQAPIVLYTLILTVVPFLFTKKIAGSPQIFLLILLLIVIAISAILNGWSGSIIRLVPDYAAAAVIPFILFSKLITTPKKHKTIMLISVLSALVMVHNGISQKLSESGVGWSGSQLSQGTRITYLGTFGDPNDLGMFLVMVIPLAIFFMSRAKAALKFFWILAIGALLYGVLLTNSRGAFLGLMSLSGLWALHKYGLKNTAALALLLLPILTLIASKFRTIDAEEESAAGRIEAWYEGFQMLIHNPFFGVGMYGFTEHHVLTAHNSYILILAELGFIGFTTWMIFVLLTFFMLYRIAFYYTPLIKKSLPAPTLSSEEFTSEVLEELSLAKVAFFSLLGFAITAFFLSRSYAFAMYIYAGIGVSSYYRSILLIPELNPIKFSQLFSRLILISSVYIIFLYLVVKILL